ncbi:MAG: efflux RND transporter periplasmic adaptor subunit [Pseudomonadota bacterium]
MKKSSAWAVGLCVIVALSGCGKKAEEEKSGKRPMGTLITVTEAKLQAVQHVQESVGWIESETFPSVAAEVAGRVVRVGADIGQAVSKGQLLAELDAQDERIARAAAQAEVARVEASLANQERLVQRYEKLVRDKFIPVTQLEDAQAQLAVLREQLAGARAQLQAAEHNLAKARIVAPVAGRIDQRMVSTGDYVTLGKPLFLISSQQTLRVHLPFPEDMASALRPGGTVRLSSSTAPGRTIESRIKEVRPDVDAKSHAVEAIVELANPGGWKPGASVNGTLVVAEHGQAVTVPEQSVVMRPAGEVVYVIREGKAEQQVVKTGYRSNGGVEILEGLAAGTVVALDGAAFLTDKAKVNIKKDQK